LLCQQCPWETTSRRAGVTPPPAWSPGRLHRVDGRPLDPQAWARAGRGRGARSAPRSLGPLYRQRGSEEPGLTVPAPSREAGTSTQAKAGGPMSRRTFLAAFAALTLLSPAAIQTSAGAQTGCDPFTTAPHYLHEAPTSTDVLGFALGTEEVSVDQSNQYLDAVANASDRVIAGTAR